MSSLLKVDRVQYLLKENEEKTLPLARLYFCVYCKCLKTPDSLQFEIDSHFCPQTLDSIPPGEAASKKNKSSISWQCPFCFHNLLTRATNTSVASPNDPTKIIPKKSYYQSCSFCRWNSRSVGIMDKEIVSGGWSEAENPHQPRIQTLVEYYKSLSNKEMAELDQKKTARKKGYFSLAFQLQQKYGSTSTASGRKQAAALSSTFSALRIKESLKEISIAPSDTVGLDEVERLPEDIYIKPVDFTQATNIEQRLDQPVLQPENLSDFKPRKSTMLIKRSLRCKSCDHNVIKPEYNASSIKFKINLSAIQHVPEVRINKLPDLEPGKKSKIILSFINPTENNMNITLQPCTTQLPGINAQIEFPATNLVLSKYDETAEYAAMQGEVDDVEKDDPDVVAFRSVNKLGFYTYVTPDDDLSRDTAIWTSFTFKYDHHGTVPIAQMLKSAEAERKPEVVWLNQTVQINLGKVKK